MKIHNILTWAAFLGAPALTVSCHLEEEPTDAIVITDGEHAINSDLELEAMRNGIYQSFRSVFYGVNSIVPEVACDGFNATSDFGNNFGPMHRMDVSFTTDDEDIATIWQNHYYAIMTYDIFISSTANYEAAGPASAARVRYCRGEAYVLRAYSYLWLVRHFSKAYNASTAATDLGVPLVLKYDQNAKPARATVKAVYDQIKCDLDSAAALGMADAPGKIASADVTADALNMMYARYYIDTKDYANAAAASARVINSSAGYAVSSTADGMAQEYTYDNGTEPIMQLPASLTENGSGTNVYYTRNDYYSALATAGYPGVGVYQIPYYLPSQKLLNLYADGDVRLAQWFQTGKVTVNLKGSYFADGITTFVKYNGNPALTSSGMPNSRQHVKPFLIGEAYLLNAEANFKNGDTAAAAASLNALQTARGASLTEATEDAIETEWFRETVGEGLRMSCLKRWGKGFSGREAQPKATYYGVLLTGTYYEQKVLPTNDRHWVLPIPSYEIRVNSKLVQNEGY